MMSPIPSEMDFRHALVLKVLDLLCLVVGRVLPWVLIALVFYLFQDVVSRLTDSQSASETWIRLMANVSRTRAFAFIFGFFGILYGLQQRNLRRDTVARMAQRITALEEAIQRNQDLSSSVPRD